MPEVATKSDGVQPRRKLGKYELIERFERGGMATVYKAYDPTLDRYVAIKQIASHLADDPRFVERFRHEAQVLAKLGDEGTHVVTIHELVEDETGGLYIVMEYVEGRTLETFLQSAPISPAAAIKLMSQVARGLKAVHQKGIIHRDIKPLNIIITPQGRVKITDFGLAAHSGGSTSMSMGTTKYMAPELFKGGPIDCRSDLYSLGFMMYELLSPVDRFNEVFEDVLTDERSEGLRWMSWHGDPERKVPPLLEMNDKVPRRLSLVVERLMAKDAEARFFSAEELLQELTSAFGRRSAGTTDVTKDLAAAAGAAPEASGAVAVAEGAGPRPLRPGDTARLPRRVNWRKRLIVMGAAAVVLLVGLIVALRIAGAPARRQRASAEERYRNAEKAYKSGAYDQARQDYQAYLEWAEKHFALDSIAVKTARMNAAMADAYVLRERRKWAEAEERVTAAETLGKDLGTDASMFREFRGGAKRLKDFFDRLEEAKKSAESRLYDDALAALDLAVKVYPDRPEEREARADVNYAKCLYEADQARDRGDFDDAAKKYRQAVKFRDTPEAAQRLRQLTADRPFLEAVAAGKKALADGQFPEAVGHLERAHRLKANDQAAADLLLEAKYQMEFKRAGDLERNQRWNNARDAYQKAIEVKDTPEARAGLARMEAEVKVMGLLADANRAQAAGDLDQAIALLAQVAGLKSVPGLQARIVDLRFEREMKRGRAAAQAGKWDEADAAYNAALNLKTNSPEAKTALDEVRKLRRYTELRDQGTKLYDAGLVEKALELYKAAQAVHSTQEIEGRIATCHYDLFMRTGREQEKANDFSGAYANYQAALRHKDTPEVREAIERVKSKVPT